jgi:hypothetical protein
MFRGRQLHHVGWRHEKVRARPKPSQDRWRVQVVKRVRARFAAELFQIEVLERLARAQRRADVVEPLTLLRRMLGEGGVLGGRGAAARSDRAFVLRLLQKAVSESGLARELVARDAPTLSPDGSDDEADEGEGPGDPSGELPRRGALGPVDAGKIPRASDGASGGPPSDGASGVASRAAGDGGSPPGKVAGEAAAWTAHLHRVGRAAYEDGKRRALAKGHAPHHAHTTGVLRHVAECLHHNVHRGQAEATVVRRARHRPVEWAQTLDLLQRGEDSVFWPRRGGRGRRVRAAPAAAARAGAGQGEGKC